ncbi:MAG: hypothetical protein JSS09_09880, partial [Verrucomicrobia bacterium]|nr:hypothetical protein [Verrucomicrobiota bacterium]
MFFPKIGNVFQKAYLSSHSSQLTSLFSLFSYTVSSALIRTPLTRGLSFPYRSLPKITLQSSNFFSLTKAKNHLNPQRLSIRESSSVSYVFEVFQSKVSTLPSLSQEGKKTVLLKADVQESSYKDPGSKMQSLIKFVAMEADALIRSSNLEGSYPKTNAYHLEEFNRQALASGIVSSETGKKIEGFFKSLEFIDREKKDKGLDFAKKVQNLQPGESAILEGGWRNEVGGHALLYVFTKKEEGLYDIYLFNTGGGIQKHCSMTVQDGIKKRILYCPYIKYQGVEPERLGLSQSSIKPRFFQNLIDIYKYKYPSGDMEKTDFRIYQSLDGFGALQDKMTAPGPETLYITPQRAGTCAFSVFLAAIRPLFSDEEEFQCYVFTLFYSDYVDLFNISRNVTLLGDSSSDHLMKVQGERLLRFLEKLSPLLLEKEVEEIKNNLHNILQTLSVSHSPSPEIIEYKTVKDEDREITGSSDLFGSWIKKERVEHPRN